MSLSPRLLLPRACTVSKNLTWKLPEVPQPGHAGRAGCSWQRASAACAVKTVQIDSGCWGGQAASAQSWFLRWLGKQFILDCVFSETHFPKDLAAATDSGLNFFIALSPLTSSQSNILYKIFIVRTCVTERVKETYKQLIPEGF